MTAVLFFSAKVGEKYIYEYLYLSVSPSDAVFILSTKCPDVSLSIQQEMEHFYFAFMHVLRCLSLSCRTVFSLAEVKGFQSRSSAGDD